MTTAPNGIDIREIMARMPHRAPFLLVDRVLEVVPNVSSKGLKNVTFNEPHFGGHFPQDPVMPGVLLIESMAQSGGFMFDLGDRLSLLGGVDRAKFRHVVRPGDQLIMDAEAIAIVGSMARARCTASVDDRVVATAEVTYVFVEGEAP